MNFGLRFKPKVLLNMSKVPLIRLKECFNSLAFTAIYIILKEEKHQIYSTLSLP